MQDAENKDGSDSSLNNVKDTDRRIYELGYLLLPTIPMENVPVSYSGLKDLVANMKGEIISDEMPKEIKLSYMMSKISQNLRGKFDTAYFGWIKFEMGSEQVLELKKKLGLDANIIRFLILKTVRENTVAAKRFIQKDFRRKTPVVKKEGEDEIPTPIDREKIDKEIDAMVAA